MNNFNKLLTLLCRKAHLPAVVLLALMSGLNAHADVAINETTFPDANFRHFILNELFNDSYQQIGADSVLTDVEIADVSSMECSYRHITSLKGIEYFTALKSLYCNDNQLRSLDVSKNTALIQLHCHNNPLMSLDVSKNTALEILDCNYIELSSLDVSKNTALTTLICSNNRLSSLDVSNNTALKTLHCSTNQLRSLDVSKNTALENLRCVGNDLTTLDVSKNAALKELYCYSNQLTELDLSNNPAISTLIYQDQTRTLTAESAVTPEGERYYYLPLGNYVNGVKSIVERMTETNYWRVASKFDPSRVLEWTSGGHVSGVILLLTDVTEDPTTKTASGTVKYKYNVNNSIDPNGDLGYFILNWTAPMPEGSTSGPAALELNENLIRLQLTQSYQLEVETPNAGEITWTSSNPEVVQVDSTGRVTALKNGTAIVKATTANGLSARCGVWSYLRGDLNEDNKVDVADLNEELNIIITQ